MKQKQHSASQRGPAAILSAAATKPTTQLPTKTPVDMPRGSWVKCPELQAMRTMLPGRRSIYGGHAREEGIVVTVVKRLKHKRFGFHAKGVSKIMEPAINSAGMDSLGRGS